MNEKIRAHSPADFLALVPRLLGYQPSSGLVVVVFAGNTSRASMRVDLDFPISMVTQMVAKTGGDAVAVIAYTEEPVTEERCDRTAVAAMGLQMEGLKVKGSFVVGNDGWAEVSEKMPTVYGLDQITGVVTEEIGLPLGAAHGTEPMEMGTEARIAITTELAKLVMKPHKYSIDQMVDLLVASLDRDAVMNEQQIAELLYMLDGSLARAVSIMFVALGEEKTRELAKRVEQNDEQPEELNFIYGNGDAPDPGVLDRAITLCRLLAAVDQDGPWSVTANTLAGWCEWARGHGSAAGVYVERALKAMEKQRRLGSSQEEPTRSLAWAVLQVVNTGTLPEWVYRQPKASE